MIDSILYKSYFLIIPSFPSEPKGRYTEGEVNIHYKSPVRREEKENIPEEELRKRQVYLLNTYIILYIFILQ